ncbi:hypothetical protein V6N13_007841 [Hibiscus sabdariffa]
MKSEMVATQFPVLITAIATTLYVLLLDFIDVDGEMKKLVALVVEQAQHEKIKINPDNERAMRWVLSILDLFKNEIKLEFQISKWDLNYLHIRT